MKVCTAYKCSAYIIIVFFFILDGPAFCKLGNSNVNEYNAMQLKYPENQHTKLCEYYI